MDSKVQKDSKEQAAVTEKKKVTKKPKQKAKPENPSEVYNSSCAHISLERFVEPIAKEAYERKIARLEAIIAKLEEENEILETLYEYSNLCLKWAESHLSFFASRKYEKTFSLKHLLTFIRERAAENLILGNRKKAEANYKLKSMLQEEL